MTEANAVSPWRLEYNRRVLVMLVPTAAPHLDHGLDLTRVEVSVTGSDAHRWSEYTSENASLMLDVKVTCICGEILSGYVDDGPEAFAKFMQNLTR